MSDAPVRVHLVDGTFELFRAYSVVPSQRTPAGQEVNAVRGLLQTLMALLRGPGVTHVACAFDHVIESFRNDLFAGYKTGEGVPQDLFSQFELAERAVTALGCVAWPMVEFEADDALATAAARFADDARVEQVLICSPDKDLYQCVGDKVIVWDRQRDRRYDVAGVQAKFGILPQQVPDFLALVGDTADGIPGIPRWGQVSAARVLSRYGSLEGIPLAPGSLDGLVRGPAGLLSELAERRDLALLYKRLATLRVDVPLPHTLDEIAYRGTDVAEFEAFCREIDVEGWTERLPRVRA